MHVQALAGAVQCGVWIARRSWRGEISMQ